MKDSSARADRNLRRPTELSCAKRYDRDQVHTLKVEYDYEIALVEGEDLSVFLDDELPRLEQGLLWATADALGFWPCENEVTDPAGTSAIVGLSSLDEDQPDVTVPEIQCQYLVQDLLEKEAYCVPMKGHMTVEYVHSVEAGKDINETIEEIQGIVLDTISSQMKQQRGLTLSALGTLYLGNRQDYARSVGPPNLQEQVSDSHGGAKSADPIGLISSVVAVSGLVVVISGMLLLRKKRKQPALVEAKSGPVSLDMIETNTEENMDSDTEAAFAVKADIEAPKLQTFAEMEDAETPISEEGDPLGGFPTSFSAPSVRTVFQESSMAQLPPLPPRRSSSPKPMLPRPAQGQRRRRKKKKKVTKNVLKRVNSRENVREMEAIPEAHDEEGSEGSGRDAESEYSWTDDDGSLSLAPSPTSSLSSIELGEQVEGGSRQRTTSVLSGGSPSRSASSEDSWVAIPPEDFE